MKLSQFVNWLFDMGTFIFHFIDETKKPKYRIYPDFDHRMTVVYEIYKVLRDNGISNYQINSKWFREKSSLFCTYYKRICDFSQNRNKLRKIKTTTTKPQSTEFRFGSRSGVCSTHATVTDENMLDIFKKSLKEAR